MIYTTLSPVPDARNPVEELKETYQASKRGPHSQSFHFQPQQVQVSELEKEGV